MYFDLKIVSFVDSTFLCYFFLCQQFIFFSFICCKNESFLNNPKGQILSCMILLHFGHFGFSFCKFCLIISYLRTDFCNFFRLGVFLPIHNILKRLDFRFEKLNFLFFCLQVLLKLSVILSQSSRDKMSYGSISSSLDYYLIFLQVISIFDFILSKS